MLIVEPDATTAQRMVAALGLEAPSPHHRRRGDAEPAEGPGRHCVLIESLRKLFEHDFSSTELVICSVDLPDGSGLNVLDYLRGTHPHLPVILVGAPDDAAVAVEAIRAGAVDFVATSSHDVRELALAVEKCLAHQRVKQENERLNRDLSSSLTELAIKNQQLQALVRQLEASARTDDLTRLCNRRRLNEMLEESWSDAAKNGRMLGLLMIDLDDFKIINDRMGHLRGDEVLRRTGEIIEANCRQGDVPGRYGGDEFCVLMPGSAALDAVQVALRILRQYERAGTGRPDGEPRISMSIGVAHIDLSRPRTSEELVQHADEALYAAKKAGKNRVMVRDRDAVRSAPTFTKPDVVEIDRVAARW